jgi:hypothetical protein
MARKGAELDVRPTVSIEKNDDNNLKVRLKQQHMTTLMGFGRSDEYTFALQPPLLRCVA